MEYSGKLPSTICKDSTVTYKIIATAVVTAAVCAGIFYLYLRYIKVKENLMYVEFENISQDVKHPGSNTHNKNKTIITDAYTYKKNDYLEQRNPLIPMVSRCPYN